MTTFKALLVEDEVTERKELVDALKEQGEIEVTDICDSNADAYQLLAKNSYDLIFLDINLRDGYSFSLLRRLKQDNIRIPPLVVVTAHTEFEYAQKFVNEYQEYIVGMLKKPFWSDWIKSHDQVLERMFVRAQRSRWKERKEITIIAIKTINKIIVIEPSFISHIATGEKYKGKSQVYLTNSNEPIDAVFSLRQLLNQLPHFLIQISRFVAVNINCIAELDHVNKEVTLKNGISFIAGNEFYQTLRELLDV
jgi:DNA-binding LytR/AlgR family response regulator